MGIRNSNPIKLQRRSVGTLSAATTISTPVPITYFFSEAEYLRRQAFIQKHCNAAWNLSDQDVAELVPASTIKELNNRLCESLLERTPITVLKEGIHVDGKDNSYEATVQLSGKKRSYLRYYLKRPINGDRTKWYYGFEIYDAKGNHIGNLTGYPTSHNQDTMHIVQTGNQSVDDFSQDNPDAEYNLLLQPAGFQIINQLLTEALAGEKTQFKPAPKNLVLKVHY